MSMSPKQAAPKYAPAAVTMGDPAGIGPDIAISCWLQRTGRDCPAFFAIGDPAVYAERATALRAAGHCPVETIAQPAGSLAVFARALPVLPLEQPTGSVFAGSPSAAHAPAIIASIETAVALTLAGAASAWHGANRQARPSGAGLCARRPHRIPCGTCRAPRLRRRLPRHAHGLAKADGGARDRPHRAEGRPAALTQNRLVRTAEITAAGLARYFAMQIAPRDLRAEPARGRRRQARPRGNRNHRAGRGAAAIARHTRSRPPARRHPVSAAARQSYDAVLAMYHDQALIPFKTLSFEDGVNVTLGLPSSAPRPTMAPPSRWPAQAAPIHELHRGPEAGQRMHEAAGLQRRPPSHERRRSDRILPPLREAIKDWGFRPENRSARTSCWTSTSPADRPRRRPA